MQCPGCLTTGFTEDGMNLDAAVKCASGEGDPPGSPDGSCCTVHDSHDDHLAGVAESGDASCRPVTVIVVPGSVRLTAGGGA